LEAGPPLRRIIFFVEQFDRNDSEQLQKLFANFYFTSKDDPVGITFVVAAEVSLETTERIINSLSTASQRILLTHAAAPVNPGRRGSLPFDHVYIWTPRGFPIDDYSEIFNTKLIPADNIAQFAVGVLVDLNGLNRPPRRKVDIEKINAVSDRIDAIISDSDLSSRRQLGELSLLSNLIAIDITIDELKYIVLLENDPNAPEIIGSWFDSKRQVALTKAGGYLAGAIAAFIGDVTIAGTAHGIFSGNFEMGLPGQSNSANGR